jgi:cytochrome c553
VPIKSGLRLAIAIYMLALLISLVHTTIVTADSISIPIKYLLICSKCHGSSGHGDGPYAEKLKEKPRNFTDCATMVGIPDGTMFMAIKNGGASVGLSSGMPSWSNTLSDPEIREMIHYLRQFCIDTAEPVRRQ